MSRPPAADWTTGAEAIGYQRCRACGTLQYFRRDFCAACGGSEVTEQRASGEGVVYAITQVARAATPEARQHVPYSLVLVDTAEGFRMMAHGDNDLAIGDHVTAHYRQFAGHLVPIFKRTTA
jgi:uncharacterized OB-fold protein